jgi:hypothetical protein
VVAFFAELKVYRIWVDKGLFAELSGILEEVWAMEPERCDPAVVLPCRSELWSHFLGLMDAVPGRILVALFG